MHISVLYHELIDSLNVSPNGTYVDCTGGGGGHAALTLEDHGIKMDAKPIVDFLKGLISVHQERIIGLYKNHDKVGPNKIN